MPGRPDAPDQSARSPQPDAAIGVVLPRLRLSGQILTPQPVHVSAGPVLPRLAIQQPQCTADDVAGLLALAAVGLDDTEILFGRAESDAHESIVQQLLDM